VKYIYTWVAAYQKIAAKLKEYQTNHIGLVKVLEAIGVDVLNDKDTGGEIIPLEDIDPFTFISYLNKYGDEKRIKLLNNLSDHWQLDETIHDVCGIPSSNAQNVWYFPYKFDRTKNEVNRLWGFYFSVMEDNVTNEQLVDIKSITGVGWTKITEGMFNLKPNKYLPLNGVVNPYLISLGIKVDNTSIDGIEETCLQVGHVTDKPFWQVSYEGWLFVEEQKNKARYWRLGTSAGKDGANILPEMINNNIASIGWDNLGDFNLVDPFNHTTLTKLLTEQNYKGVKNVASRKANEILSFVNKVSLNDYIIAMDGAQVRAIARVLHNQYIYLDKLDFPNARIVDWIKKDVSGVSFEEGLQTTMVEIIDPTNINKINRLISKPNMPVNINAGFVVDKHPLNQILYGPPGTGKTYNSIDRAVKIATTKSGVHAENKILFDQLRKEGQIEFVTFHQGYSYEDFMVGIKPNVDSDHLTFKPYKGIFYRLVERAKENYIASKEERSTFKSFDEVFEAILKPFEEDRDVKIEMASGAQFKITDVENGTIRFKKQNGSDTHTLSVETLRAIVEGKRDFHSGLSSYYKPLVKLLKENQRTDEPKAVLKNYVLIIDEINRANISKVFGELITLLEDDKRIDAENSLSVTLPNGELNFSIPPNLHIIGTMNTADKSISLIDVALRRRFEFIGYYPDVTRLAANYADRMQLLEKLNEAIFTRKKTADYLIGHGYFMKAETTEQIILNKIIPLLMEYFSGRVDEVQEILKYAGREVQYNTSIFKWEFGSKITAGNESTAG
jgi:5-methylcytosine-specific restriction protein B